MRRAAALHVPQRVFIRRMRQSATTHADAGFPLGDDFGNALAQGLPINQVRISPVSRIGWSRVKDRFDPLGVLVPDGFPDVAGPPWSGSA